VSGWAVGVCGLSGAFLVHNGWLAGPSSRPQDHYCWGGMRCWIVRYQTVVAGGAPKSRCLGRYVRWVVGSWLLRCTYFCRSSLQRSFALPAANLAAPARPPVGSLCNNARRLSQLINARCALWSVFIHPGFSDGQHAPIYTSGRGYGASTG